MIIFTDKNECTGCAACYSACPCDCITMQADNEGFLYPIIDEKECIDCGVCSKTCELTKDKNRINRKIKWLGIKSQNTEERIRSSSGGIFSLISNEIIENHGLVFGAAFDTKWKVVHESVDSIEGIARLRGSKYVQSDVLDTYKEVRKALLTGRMVYFSGTPCQIAGLKAYLNKEYNNLITQDFVCHGVPSPAVWESYLNGVAKKQRVQRVSHRDKNLSWSRFSLTIEREKGKKFSEDLTENSYLRGFLSNLYLRPSCHNCRYKGEERISDITLADFWGCNTLAPSLYDEKGCSLVFVNTSKGQGIIERILENTYWEAIDDNHIFDYNSAAIRSVHPHKDRRVFFERFQRDNNTEKLILELLGDSLIKKNIRVRKRKIRGKLSMIKRRFIAK